ncbi:MAG: DUF2007 domain-containing protein [Chlorobi bacterium]|nr:DUF2007 domain-containing protein [Chlorobiota bacterium]
MRSIPHDDPSVLWALLYTTNTVWEAELVRGYLGAHGIAAVVVPQVDSTRGITVGGLAIAKVYVPVTELGRAEHILATYRHNNVDSPPGW